MTFRGTLRLLRSLAFCGDQLDLEGYGVQLTVAQSSLAGMKLVSGRRGEFLCARS